MKLADIVGKGTMKIKMHNGCERILGDVRYVHALRRNWISLGKLVVLGYWYSTRDGVMQICRGSFMMMRGKKTNGNLYKLIGETMVDKDSGGVYSKVKKWSTCICQRKR